MLRSKLVPGIFLSFLAVAVGSAQPPTLRGNGLPGYLDPGSGVFRPMPTGTRDFSQQAVTVRTGLIIVRFNITIRSPIPPAHAIGCVATANVLKGTATPGFFLSSHFEEESVYAARTGNKAVYTVRMGYSWGLDTPENAEVSLNYNIGVTNETSRTGFANRISVGPIAEIPMPENGATTNFTIDAVI